MPVKVLRNQSCGALDGWCIVPEKCHGESSPAASFRGVLKRFGRSEKFYWSCWTLRDPEKLLGDLKGNGEPYFYRYMEEPEVDERISDRG